MKLDFRNKTEEEKNKLIGEGYSYIQEKAEKGKLIEIVDKDDNKKTKKQQNGYWRLVGLVFPFLAKDCGEIKSAQDAHEFIKIQSDFFKVIKTKHKEVVIPKSLTEATKFDVMKLIDKLYFICEFYGIKDYELKMQEKEEIDKLK